LICLSDAATRPEAQAIAFQPERKYMSGPQFIRKVAIVADQIKKLVGA